MHHSDIEHVLPQSSSSYGSLEDSSGSNLQQSSDGNGLSMHERAATAAANAAFGSEDFEKQNEQPNSEHRGHTHDCDHEHHPAHHEHLVKSRQYYRDMVLGVNDGLVSTFLLVAGVVGGGMDVSGVLLTAVSGAIAGAISMFAGEYVATKSQNEVMEGEIKLEHDHIKRYHSEEMKELTHLLTLIGIPGSQPHLNFESNENEGTTQLADNGNGVATNTTRETRKLRRRLTNYYANKPDALLKIMIALEFGIIDEEVRSPFVAGGTSLALFFLGALPSTIPFAFIKDATLGLVVAGVACGIGLFIVGAVKTWATRGNMWLAAMENLMITAAGGAVAYGIGVGFQSLVGEDE